jgi:hypothetical protein
MSLSRLLGHERGTAGGQTAAAAAGVADSALPLAVRSYLNGTSPLLPDDRAHGIGAMAGGRI